MAWRSIVLFVPLLLLPASPARSQTELRYPPVAGGQIRIEGYLVPAVTSWPAYPAWAPGGREIAFSMHGDIWIVPVDGGAAVQLTQSPGYDFEPDWSPDGRTIAFSRDVGGNLDIYVISRANGREVRLTEDPALDFHPRWRSDRELLFMSARDGHFDVLSVSVNGETPQPVLGWETNEIQPEPSPRDPGTFAVVSTRSGRIGTGGIWRIRDGEAEELHFEETTFRTRPAWSPDGRMLAYVSDAAGTNDLWLLETESAKGIPFRLTRDDRADELTPSWSPDGNEIVYATNRGGVGALEIFSLYGGTPRRVEVTALERRSPSGRLRVRLSQPSRVSILGSDGRYHAPDGVFRRVVSFTETHYFHARELELELPPGPAEVRVSRGPEHVPETETVQIEAGRTAELAIEVERLADLAARGWYSGDTHVHDLHAGDLRLGPEALMDQIEAEDVDVAHALIHIDGTKLMGDLERFRPGPHPASRPGHLLRYGQEYRMPFGHRTVLGGSALFFPLVSGLAHTAFAAPFPPLFDYLRRLRAEQPEALVGAPHPYFPYLAEGKMPPPGSAPSTIPVDVALGVVDFFDVNCIWSDERVAARIYARLLNAGFRLPAAGGSDTFSDVWRDPPPGTGRTYVRVDGPLTLASWMEGLRAGRSFSTNGPLLELDVEGKEMGEELAIGSPRSVRVRARAISAVPVRELDVLVNGETVHSVRGGGELSWEGAIPIERSSWIALRAEGERSHWITDSYLFAHSTPVYVVVNGAPIRVEEDRAYLERYVSELLRYAEGLTTWKDAAQRELTLAGFREARDVLRRSGEGDP